MTKPIVGGRPAGRRTQTVSVKSYHLPFLQELGGKIGTDDLSECLNFALNLLKSGDCLSDHSPPAGNSDQSQADRGKGQSQSKGDTNLNEADLMDALKDIF
ncbi:hypothetical protein ABN584_27500 [Gloeocapsa sp. BRSZ]